MLPEEYVVRCLLLNVDSFFIFSISFTVIMSKSFSCYSSLLRAVLPFAVAFMAGIMIWLFHTKYEPNFSPICFACAAVHGRLLSLLHFYAVHWQQIVLRLPIHVGSVIENSNDPITIQANNISHKWTTQPATICTRCNSLILCCHKNEQRFIERRNEREGEHQTSWLFAIAISLIEMRSYFRSFVFTSIFGIENNNYFNNEILCRMKYVDD